MCDWICIQTYVLFFYFLQLVSQVDGTCIVKLHYFEGLSIFYFLLWQRWTWRTLIISTLQTSGHVTLLENTFLGLSSLWYPKILPQLRASVTPPRRIPLWHCLISEVKWCFLVSKIFVGNLELCGSPDLITLDFVHSKPCSSRCRTRSLTIVGGQSRFSVTIAINFSIALFLDDGDPLFLRVRTLPLGWSFNFFDDIKDTASCFEHSCQHTMIFTAKNRYRSLNLPHNCDKW